MSLLSRVMIAPMMDWTDRHDRYFLRILSPSVGLYTEMIHANAIIQGDRDYLLKYHPAEHPLAIQLGGSCPKSLAEASRIAEDFGYDEINLNVGCPSPRVSSGQFGACLMLSPNQVAACIRAMKAAVSIPVTIKCRIGVDHHDGYDALSEFVALNRDAGCDAFIVHARKAWLTGLSPKENREIPPLRYEVVHQLKSDFPSVPIAINGGIQTLSQIDHELNQLDGVMIGRMAYKSPYFLTEVERYLSGREPKSRSDVMAQLMPYLESQIKQGVRLHAMTRHILGLYQGKPGAARWRRALSERAHLELPCAEVIQFAQRLVECEI